MKSQSQFLVKIIRKNIVSVAQQAKRYDKTIEYCSVFKENLLILLSPSEFCLF